MADPTQTMKKWLASQPDQPTSIAALQTLLDAFATAMDGMEAAWVVSASAVLEREQDETSTAFAVVSRAIAQTAGNRDICLKIERMAISGLSRPRGIFQRRGEHR